MQREISIPMFRVGVYRYETVLCHFECGRPIITIAPILGLDALVIEEVEVTGLFHLPDNETPLVPIAAPVGAPGLTRRHIIDGVRRALRYLYRQARALPELARVSVDRAPPLHQLLVVGATYTPGDRLLDVHLEAVPGLMQRTPYDPPEF